MRLTGRAIVSRLREVTHLPLFKILAYIDFGRGEFVLPPTVYEWGNGGEGGSTRFSEMGQSSELIPRLKFGRLVGWGYDGNLASRQYLPKAISGEERVVGAHGWRPRCMNGADR